MVIFGASLRLMVETGDRLTLLVTSVRVKVRVRLPTVGVAEVFWYFSARMNASKSACAIGVDAPALLVTVKVVPL